MSYQASIKFVYFNAKKGDPIMNEDTAVQELDTPAAPAVNTKSRARKPKAKGKAKPKAAAPKKERSDADRSASVKESWSDPKVAKARAARHHVKVGGKEYSSVMMALTDLGLPAKYCIPFRKKLKASGKEVLEYEGEKYTFTLVANKE